MKFDDFKTTQLFVQLTYAPAYLIWDRAGLITRDLSAIWPRAELGETEPNQQLLRTQVGQITTSINKAHLGLTKLKAFDEHYDKIKRTYDVWSSNLELDVIDHLSARAIYHLIQPSIEVANEKLLGAGIVRWPTRKVFNQDEQSSKNTLAVNFQYEDSATKTIIRIRTESAKFEMKALDALEEIEPVTQEQHRIVVDVDRILQNPTQAKDLRILDWLEGFHHLIKRDVPTFF
jgi:hypothetical protein